MFPQIITNENRRTVKNQFPVMEPGEQRVAIVGEAPGEHEENYGIPFVGASGQLLDRTLLDVGLDRRRCFIGNVCQHRPPGNDIGRFSWDGLEIQAGLRQLRDDLTQFNPNIVVLLGNAALRAAGQSGKVSEWRGSLFQSTLLDGNVRKCVSTLHPAAVLREFSGFPLLKFDLQRAARESTTPTLNLPQRELITNAGASELCYLLDTWPSGHRCSLDIEGGLGGWPCVSVSGNPLRSHTIAWGRLDEDGHARVLQSFARLMGRTDVPKVLQNSLYDNFVLSFGHGILIRNVAEDTMLKGWEAYCELPKGLGTQASIWTREPYWKSDRHSDDSETYFRYCAKDSAVTLEICEAQDGALDATSYSHYNANVQMLNPLLFMELRGIRYDQEKVTTTLNTVREQIRQVGDALEAVAGSTLKGDKGSLSSTKLAYCLYQRDPGTTPKGKVKPKVEWKNSAYPPQFKKENGRLTDKVTTDIEAILNLRRKFPGDEFLSSILQHRHLEGLLETLSIKSDPDGRVRCGYNVVGTETGRLTCYGSPTGAGANLQTITKSLRGNYTADPGYDFFQCDLEGADGWTVAAHCARLGDRTMLDDYYAGIKPAKVIGLLYYFGAEINRLDRAPLKHACDIIFPIVLEEVGKWLYLGCKRVQHGSNYLMGIPTMLLNIMKDSYKESGTPVYMEHSVATELQRLYFLRYPGVKTWHMWGESQLRAHGVLRSASGQLRQFFGRRFGPDIKDTIKEFLAHEPQSNTTYSTNLAMLRLWEDPANRLNRIWDNPANGARTLVTCDGGVHVIPPQDVPYVSHLRGGSLLVEPLHQVHDALCGQWPQSLRPWARGKVREWFQNELTIAGTTLIIPFDGAYGPSWGEQPHKL